MGRGWLRIYLGASPGVGKTYAMLNEGLRRRSRGTDVVVGLVETHGRAQTAAQVEDLEVIPRRPVDYRGQTLEEMDLPAILARRPDVVLIDELAHTNIPGVEHDKRYEDVEVLLAEGINVISTLNLQHLESVSDVVETIIGVPQRETVPDGFVRSAEQIELIDMTPEALRRRLAHGNVYPAERVDAALTHFFRPGNLAALRELSLLWLADRVDTELQAYRERHHIDTAWETKERVAVAITGSPETARLIRRAARMSRRAKAELVGVNVRRDDGLQSRSDTAVDHNVALLTELGGRFVEVVSNDVAVALVAVARAENATQLVIGARRRSRVSELVHGSIVTRCVREARGDIDLHVIGVDASSPGARTRRTWWSTASGLSQRRIVAGLALGAVGLPLMTALLTSGAVSVSLAVALSAYLLVVIGVAAVGGIIPGLLAAVAAFLVSNYEFAPPIHTLTIANARDLLALTAFLVAGLTVATLVDVAARRSTQAVRAERNARALARLVSTVSLGDEALEDFLAEFVRTFELNGAALRRTGRGAALADEVVSGTLTGPTASVALDETHELVVAGGLEDPESQALLRGVASQIVSVLERQRLEREARERDQLRQADELRAALLAAVSHDLRTPLASIKTAATSLLSPSAHFTPEQHEALLESIDAETDRLSGLIEGLLDMTRVNEGTVEFANAEVDLVDLVEYAIEDAVAAANVLPSAVRVTGLDAVPMTTDATLVVRIVANLVQNGLIHGGGEVAVDVGLVGNDATIRVVDHGSGVPPEDREAIFLPFQRRGDVRIGRGVGLGLAIARGFTAALGGTLAVDDTPGGGCTMVLSLPLVPAAAPPPVATASR
jgi:two-component system sensor histidine kinase KdpD